VESGTQRRHRVLIFVVAYQAETTLLGVLRRLPPALSQWQTEILVIDDASTDATFDRGLDWSREAGFSIRVLANPSNQGYGGNQKLGYRYAVDQDFDAVVLLHGDGQYAPEKVCDLLRPILDGRADAVMGSRMLERSGARRGGMPLYKFVGNRILTAFQNTVLGTRLSEYHSGYRAYRVSALAQLPFEANTNDFHFDTELLIQFLRRGLIVSEVPIPTYYGDEICRVAGLKYALNVMLTTLRSRLHSMGLGYDRRYDVRDEGNERYTLKLGYLSSHTAALAEVPLGARVLDIGCGPASLAAELQAAGHEVVGVDQHMPPANSFAEFHVWREGIDEFPEVGNQYDCILLLDVIEHLREPEALLDLLRAMFDEPGRRPRLLISTGNVAFAPIRLQTLLGNFNYGKRGILDLTHTRLYTFNSLRRLLEQGGFEIERMFGIPAPFPLALGLNRFARLWPRLFAYQIFAVARPLPTARALLHAALVSSAERSSTRTSPEPRISEDWSAARSRPRRAAAARTGNPPTA
jgi:2-polyprenyl-3-methyl-5-hydroxy-6-metoxy-1,4-benzoquinol methylase